MKKISLIFVLFLFISLTSCSAKSYKYYENDYDEFVSSLYNSTTNPTEFVAVDLRSKEEYVLGHVRQMQSYDYSKGSNSELITWLTGMYSKKHILYIYSTTELDNELISLLKKNYNKIYILVDTKGQFIEKADESLIIDQGDYDCHC